MHAACVTHITFVTYQCLCDMSCAYQARCVNASVNGQCRAYRTFSATRMTFDEILVFEDHDSEVNIDPTTRPVSEDVGEGAAAVLSNDEVDEASQEDEGQDVESDEEDSQCVGSCFLSSRLKFILDHSLDTIQRLESIMLDFLAQLVHAMPSAGNSNQGRQTNRKVTIELIDRKKRVQPDGYAYTL